MFGKKKVKDEDGAPEALAEATAKGGKAAKSKKAKKSKKVVNQRGPGFFAQHLEKMLMALVIGGVGYFFYAGFSADGYNSSRTPDDLKSKSNNALTQIKQDHWDAIKDEEERKVEIAYVENTKKAREPIAYDNWETKPPYVWGEPPSDSYERRGDPTLLPPEQLIVMNVNGALAVQVPKEAPDPYEDFKDAEKIEKKGRSSRRRRGDGGTQGYGGDGGYGGMEGMGGEMDGMEGMGGDGMYGSGDATNANQRRLSADYDLGAPINTNSRAAGGMMGGGMMGGEGYGGMMGGMSGAGSTVPGGRDGLENKQRDRGPKVKVASKPVIFNAITAVMPHKQIYESYKENLENTGQFISSRDVPVYLSFEVQRVDVTNDPSREVKEEEWKTLTDGGEQSQLYKIQKWATRPPLGMPVREVVERNSVDRGLTMPIPPLLVRDYREFSRHPAVGWSWNFKPLVAPPDPSQKKDDEDDEVDKTQLPGANAGRGNPGGMGA